LKLKIRERDLTGEKNRKKKPNPELDHGRGLTIISEYCSEYSYNEKGNKLKMAINKSAAK